ncbi:Uncharacterized protein DBV15_02340 [Temnothorax longispinosus]|uniref:Cyclin-like domain-containing protein n=1 Tax=Temnothorax longispinosus TaxID=300112 RepID=A0A4V3S7W1_9HYME|nr:Uncharacterized protein DBV15_02340 [Temnothorax longispinosus]
MSGRTPLSDRKALKYGINKENVPHSTVQNGKSTEGRNDGGGAKKKGLSLRRSQRIAEKRAVRTMLVQGCSSVSGEAKFRICSDDNDENVRSRPRVKKDVRIKKEIRARQDRTLEKAIESTTKADTPSRPRVVLCRARSSSNSRQIVPLNETEMNNKLFHKRAYSETRKQRFLSRYPPCVAQSSDDRKMKHLTDDVKKRTFSSIQMWKDKMKPHNGTVPKNIMGNIQNVDKTRAKTKLRKSSVVHGSVDLQSQNRATNLDENIQEPAPNDSLPDVLKFLIKEIAMIVEDKPSLKAHFDMRNFIQDNNLSTTIMLNSNIATRSPFTSTPAEVLVKQENELDNICEAMYVHDHWEAVLDTEQKKEQNAPRLSPCFSRKSVNAELRSHFVVYLIRLGVHCNYSQHIIYQTVKLFNVAIDRILVEISDIQLLCLACLWITLKREAPEQKIPSATKVLKFANNWHKYEENNLLTYERKILAAVGFNTQFADPYILVWYHINVNRDIIRPDDKELKERIYCCGSYMIDLSMLDESLCAIPAYMISIAAVELSLQLVYSSDVNVDRAWYQDWRSKQSLTEWDEHVMNSTKHVIIQQHTALKNNDYFGNWEKYMRDKYGSITEFLPQKLNLNFNFLNLSNNSL